MLAYLYNSGIFKPSQDYLTELNLIEYNETTIIELTQISFRFWAYMLLIKVLICMFLNLWALQEEKREMKSVAAHNSYCVYAVEETVTYKIQKK